MTNNVLIFHYNDLLSSTADRQTEIEREWVNVSKWFFLFLSFTLLGGGYGRMVLQFFNLPNRGGN